MKKITVAVYHVEKSGAGKRGLLKRLDPATNAWTHARMLRYSIRKCSPGAKFVLLTDTDSPVDASLFDEVRRYEVDRDAIMYERTRVQIEYLESLPPDEGLLCFLDTDMLVVRRSFFEGIGTAPLALTIREDEITRVNGGVILVNMRKHGEALSLLKSALEIYARDFSDKKAWWGDQLAFDALLETPEGSSVQQLDCNEFNYSPGPFRSAWLMVHTANRSLLHFKGTWKRYMPVVFCRYWALGCMRNIGLGVAFTSGFALLKDCLKAAITRIPRHS